MASFSASLLSFQPSFRHSNNRGGTLTSRNCSKLVSVSRGFHNLNARNLRVSCAAKPETVEKVCNIVRQQLALAPEKELTPGSKFSELGADSLDTVEIVMGLEEEFGITVEEESSQNITTVQEAADLIENLLEKKGPARTGTGS